MIKKIIAVFAFLALSMYVSGQALLLKEIENNEQLKNLFSEPAIIIHYYNDNLAIYTSSRDAKPGEFLLDKSIESRSEYFITFSEINTERLSLSNAIVLHKTRDYTIYKIQNTSLSLFIPSSIRINPGKKAHLTKKQEFNLPTKANPLIQYMVVQASGDSVWAHIQHLQNYGTRLCTSPQAVQAQNWILQYYQALGLETMLHDFSYYQGCSDNVIAIQRGVINPDRYIVIGGHYDSYTFAGGSAPGADDNASGTGGVMEVARILSQYRFNYSIIYCAFSAEEVGLVGSEAFVDYALNHNFDMMGYLNLDMIGYLQAGAAMHTDIIAPNSAKPLANYYKQVVTTYVNGFIAYDGSLAGGDSDHTSFNTSGIMGIFPFEDDENYSPYIHSANDLLGTSVNSKPQLEKFVQASIAFTASFAEPFNGYYPPKNLTLDYLNSSIHLSWEKPQNADYFMYYRIYRNNYLYDTLRDVNDTIYTDFAIANGINYQYFITGVYFNDTLAESNPTVEVGFTPGVETLYSWNFESGIQGWQIQATTHSWQINHPVNLQGNTTSYLSIDSDGAGSGTHVWGYAVSPVMDLTAYSIIALQFDYAYRDYTSDFFKVVYRTSPEGNWNLLTELTENLTFTTTEINLPSEALTSNTQVAFFYDDNNTWAWYAAVDNIKITGSVMPPQLPAPSELKAERSNFGIELSWDFNVDAYPPDWFIIYRNGIPTDSVTGNQNNFTEAPPVMGMYYYFVTASYSQGNSAPSNQARVYFDAVGFPVFHHSRIIIYPNPVKSSLSVFSPDAIISSITIYDMTGLKIAEIDKMNLNDAIIPVSMLNQGIYAVNIKTSSGNVIRKFVKK